jgi:tetratricopeptide (TPR) repeat protein
VNESRESLLPEKLPEGWFSEPGTVLAVEAEPGGGRRAWLAERLREAAEGSARTWLLDCDFGVGGPWAGIHEFFVEILPEIRAQRPDLLAKHDYELVHVVPELKRELAVRNPTLTDLSPPEEKVRNYPADRAYRIVHGLINLLDAWKGASEEPWVLACDAYDAGGHIGRTFLRELLRRRGKRLRIVLIAGVSPGRGRAAREELGTSPDGVVLTLDLPSEPEPAVDRREIVRQLQELQARVTGDRLEIQIHLPELLRLCRLAGSVEGFANWQHWGLDIFNNLGFYEDAIQYGERSLAFFRECQPAGTDGPRWGIFVKLFMSYVALQQPDRALRLAEEEAIGKTEDPRLLSRLSYLMAMLHARYLPSRDLHKGEEYLDQGMADLARADMDEDDLHFQSVFNRNGLAMIRNFQGRFQEAIELCREGFRELETHLRQDRHRLHRSVLLFNMAQVYAAVGAYDDALRHFSLAMDMDPNYSEYYNDRGNVYLKMGLFAEACADYRKAIELSPPYHEVYTNLGQAFRRMSRWEDAVRAYSVALDLDPKQALALAGRGQCHDALGRLAEAEADYSVSLAIDPTQWDVLASRAVVRYLTGDLAASLVDLDRALELSPGNADLYQNRAIALADLGRDAEAARDLETYLCLQPEAEDRQEVELRLQALTGGSLGLDREAPPHQEATTL